MDKEMQAKHAGFVNKRVWHKVRWTKGPHLGRFDLFTDEDLAEHKDSVEVIETVKADMCASGVSYAFGMTPEEKIDEWILQNRK